MKILKFRYYLYYKNQHYNLYDRKKRKVIYQSISFDRMYNVIKQLKIDFSDVYFKHLSLYEFFRDYASFDDEPSLRI